MMISLIEFEYNFEETETACFNSKIWLSYQFTTEFRW